MTIAIDKGGNGIAESAKRFVDGLGFLEKLRVGIALRVGQTFTSREIAKVHYTTFGAASLRMSSFETESDDTVATR